MADGGILCAYSGLSRRSRSNSGSSRQHKVQVDARSHTFSFNRFLVHMVYVLSSSSSLPVCMSRLWRLTFKSRLSYISLSHHSSLLPLSLILLLARTP